MAQKQQSKKSLTNLTPLAAVAVVGILIISGIYFVKYYSPMGKDAMSIRNSYQGKMMDDSELSGDEFAQKMMNDLEDDKPVVVATPTPLPTISSTASDTEITNELKELDAEFGKAIPSANDLSDLE